MGCSTAIGGVDTSFAFSAATTAGSGIITIQVTSPSGTDTVYNIPVTVT
jgi:hypothetical protein